MLWVGSIFVSLKEGWEPQGMLQVGGSLLVCMYMFMYVCVVCVHVVHACV